MSDLKELVDELDNYFQCQHRAHKADVEKAIQRIYGDDLNSVPGSWYKYYVENNPSTKRYRVIRKQEPNMTAASNKSDNTDKKATHTESTETPEQMAERLHQEDILREEMKQEENAFSRGVDWIATKIKNNRGLLGMVAGVGLTYAGQAAAEKYRERQREIQQSGTPMAADGSGNQGGQTS